MESDSFSNEEPTQSPLAFDDLPSLFLDPPSSSEVRKRRKKQVKSLEMPVFSPIPSSNQMRQTFQLEGIPEPTLPTRWEGLQDKLGDDWAKLRTIIRPIHEAMRVVDDLVRYVRTTGGCQLLVIRADTGSGKTTFLNTLPHYMENIRFRVHTLDLEELRNEERFGDALWSLETPKDGSIYLIILEGREEPYRVTDAYVQSILSAINRFSRNRKVPLLFVIPTPDDHVARHWCEYAQRIGDLIPEAKSYGGSRWYNFPGVPKEKYIEVTESTVGVLNAPKTLSDFGISPDEMESLAEMSTTIGRLMETLASRISTLNRSTILPLTGGRDHVWIVYAAPDLRHTDHTYGLVDALCLNEKLQASALKLVTPKSETSTSKMWRQPEEWARLVATLNLLDIRLINLPMITVVLAAQASDDEDIIQSFKETKLEAYRKELVKEFPQLMQEPSKFWKTPLLNRKEQVKNARESLERTNLYSLLRGSPAREQRGLPETPMTYAQYLHLRSQRNESNLHFFLRDVLYSSLKRTPFPGFKKIEAETPFIEGLTDPIPDITIRTDTDNYLLEFHFLQKQFRSSEITRYALERVISKYMRALPYLSSLLREIKK